MKRKLDTDELALMRFPVAVANGAFPELAVWCGVDAEGRGLVRLDGSAEPIVARVLGCVRMDCLQGGADAPQVLVIFVRGDRQQPIILDVVHERVPAQPSNEPLLLSSDAGIELRCKEASIAMRPSGHVVIKGTRVETDADETNRIKGASVRIN